MTKKKIPVFDAEKFKDENSFWEFHYERLRLENLQLRLKIKQLEKNKGLLQVKK
jgi:hypothetical protein